VRAAAAAAAAAAPASESPPPPPLPPPPPPKKRPSPPRPPPVDEGMEMDAKPRVGGTTRRRLAAARARGAREITAGSIAVQRLSLMCYTLPSCPLLPAFRIHMIQFLGVKQEATPYSWLTWSCHLVHHAPVHTPAGHLVL
jgi:hypothetical protein